MNLNWTRRILAMVLCLCMLFSGSVLAEEVVGAIAEAVVDAADAPVVEEVAVEAAEEAAPIELIPLAAPEVIPQAGWEQSENNALIIPCDAEEITFKWTAVEGAASYRVETAHISEEGKPENVQAIGTVTENSIALPAASYQDGWYAIAVIAEAEDGRNSAGMQIFCLQAEAEEPAEDDEEVAEDVDVSEEATALTIIQQPQSVTVAAGETATVSVQAIGDGLKYEWYIRNANASSYSKSSITTNTYSVVMDESRNGRRLICYVSDQYGNKIQCNTVQIKMSASNPLRIIQQPQNQKVAEGQKTSVTVVAAGDGLTYAWFMKDPGDTSYTKSSITSPTYATVMNSTRDGRLLICYVYDMYGNSVKCNTVKISMGAPLVITQQPKNQTVAEGQKTSVTVKATGDGLTYAWFMKDPGDTSYTKSSITSNVYATVMNATRNGRLLICYVYDAYGRSVKCNTVKISMAVSEPLVIAQQPKNITVNAGQTASVAVVATGTGLKYEWYKKDASESSYTKTSVTTSVYSVTMSSSVNGRRLICYVSDAAGTRVQCNTVQVKMLSSSAPSLSVSRVSDGNIKLSWNQITNAQGYYVYRSSDGSTYTRIATISSGSTITYTATNQTKGYYYYYMVRAFANSGNALGTLSNEPGIFTIEKVNPTITSATVSGSSITVRWNSLTAVDYVRLFIDTDSSFPEYEYVTLYSGTSYTFTGLSADTYYFKMDAYYESLNGYDMGYTAGYSSTVSATVTGSGSSTSGGDGVVTYRALLIGNLYPGTTSELPGPDNDISAMAKMLNRQTASDYDIWTGKNVSASTMLSGITQVFGDADEDDVSLYYYSGHGTSSGSLVGNDFGYVTVSNLRNKLDTIKGKKIVILDSCYSGAHINKEYGEGTIDYTAFNDAVISTFVKKDRTLTTNDYVVMTACSKTQTSSSLGFYDSYAGGYFYFGGFTYGVTKGSGFEMIDWANCSRYADSNSNGKITLAEAFNYAHNQAKNYLGLAQNAQYYGDTSFVLWKY